MSSREIEQKAIEFVKKNKKIFIKKYASLKNFPKIKNPVTMIMAGSPGAGKTEFSTRLIALLEGFVIYKKIVRIDADDLKNTIPMYNKSNSYQV